MDESEQYEKICEPHLTRIEGYVKKIFTVLEGNGNPGLVEKVARHDERIRTIQSWGKWAIGIGTGIICGVSTGIILYILTHKPE